MAAVIPYGPAPVVALHATPQFHYAPAPIGVYGVVSQPLPLHLQPAYAAVVRADRTANNPNVPPSLRPGMNYMFGPEHTHLHIFNKASRIWEDKYGGKSYGFRQFKVSTSLTVQHVINNVLRANGDEEKCKDWAITEVFEHGSGRWVKGSTTDFTSDKAKKTLSGVGWGKERGGIQPPVWLVVHKVPKKTE